MKRVTAEAAGRLDFLGGVADYSGSLVLEMPLRRSTKVTLSSRRERGLVFNSPAEGRFVVEPGMAIAAMPKWVRYPYGCFELFCREWGWSPDSGLEFSITSTVPASMGVSSSAALEVATMRALEKFSGRRFTGTGLARLAQRAENEIVGAPCGLMDQLASAHGTPGALLPILCRPDILGQPVRLPRGIVAVGWPSGVKHAVSASPYATARAGAFMGRRLFETGMGRELSHAAELAPSEVRAASIDVLPERITGREFLRRCGGVDDPLTKVQPGTMYDVRKALLFPVEENFRAETTLALLRRNDAGGDDALRVLGELLYQSHAGYSSIGLGCPETDQMVAAIRERGPARGFYGARVSGGGSGGTVVVLLRSTSLEALRRLSRTLRFVDETLPLLA